jgi:chemotaxis protein CheX
VSNTQSRFIKFSKPFIDGLSDTFKVMMDTEVKAHSPKVKTSNIATGDISALIGLNGVFENDGNKKSFKGLLVLSWSEEFYIKMASKMLMEEYTEYSEEIQDVGAELSNIVMGNAKGVLNPMGYKIEMASPSTVRGKQHEVIYPQNTTVIEITITSDMGQFMMELCYQEV